MLCSNLILLLSFATVELNEVGFKFVRKCINAVETKGQVPALASGGAAILALLPMAWDMLYFLLLVSEMRL